MRVDFANIRSAWQRAVLAANAALIEPHVTSFGEFIKQFGGMVDGNMLFAQAVDRFDGSPAQQELVAHLLVEQTPFVRGLHGLPALCPLQQRVLTLTKNPKLQANAHFNLANHFAEQGEWSQADFHFDQTEALVVWEPMQHPNRYEAVAGRAAALWQLGRAAEVLPLTEEVLTFVAGAPEMAGVVEPVLLLLNCDVVIAGCGEQGAAQRALQYAEAWVQMVAGRISDETVRTAFLARPDVQKLFAKLVAKRKPDFANISGKAHTELG